MFSANKVLEPSAEPRHIAGMPLPASCVPGYFVAPSAFAIGGKSNAFYSEQRVKAGNCYINCNQMGAVVRVWPFSGRKCALASVCR